MEDRAVDLQNGCLRFQEREDRDRAVSGRKAAN